MLTVTPYVTQWPKVTVPSMFPKLSSVKVQLLRGETMRETCKQRRTKLANKEEQNLQTRKNKIKEKHNQAVPV